ncbi:hypothetical protein [Paenibacillus koleovorans]|uniref:hypothetical protein n=1 Tax=Paenibacillus koleovorans TaxID=121608 RepID=UPI000FD735FD|nr:hypothetical protein [Paenibacillus koleovorans]
MKTKLTLVTAPAGYGKTTALSEWAKQCGAAIAWVSLDVHDNSLVRFWSYVLAAIQRAAPSFGNVAPPAMENVQPEPFLTLLLTELNKLPDELSIVLDDFHLVEQPYINNSTAYFLEFLPPHIHLLVASRSKLSIPLSRLKARGHLQQITSLDLRFHLDEGIPFFRDCMDLPLSEEEVQRLVDSSEGWVSGLQLAALSLRQTDNHKKFIREFGGSHRDIAGYLFEELLQHQPHDVQIFLLETSVLTRMNSSLCEAVTGQSGCQIRLELLDQMNLFIIPLDERKDWYRYHHLFSEFLQQYFLQKYPQRREETLAKAAEWAEVNGLEEEAIDYYIAGNHFSDVIRLIEKHLLSLVKLKSSRLYRWLQDVPERFMADKPLLTIFYIAVLIAVGELAMADSRLRTAREKLTDPDWEPFAGTIYMFCANMAYIRKDIEQANVYYEQFEKRLSEGQMLQMIGGNSSYTVDASDYDNILGFVNDLHVVLPIRLCVDGSKYGRTGKASLISGIYWFPIAS